MEKMKQTKQLIKKSEELDKLLAAFLSYTDDFNNPHFDELLNKTFIDCFGDGMYEDFIYIGIGVDMLEHSRKVKKPIYSVQTDNTDYRCRLFFVEDFEKIKKLLQDLNRKMDTWSKEQNIKGDEEEIRELEMKLSRLKKKQKRK
jgi:hypothetical protein